MRRRSLLAFALLLAACTAASPYMRPTTYASSPPPADKASVVFIRPTDFGSAVRFAIFDAGGRYLGDALPEAYFEALLEPGQHWFYADAENTGVMSAQLEAGKRYYVAVMPRPGSWSARVELMALAPRSKDWPNVKRWLAQLEALEVDRAAGQAALDEKRAAIDEAIADGQQDWAAGDSAFRDQRSLFADDGEASEPVAPQAARDTAPASDAAAPDAAAPDAPDASIEARSTEPASTGPQAAPAP